jgi:molybdate transport system substrate-binding protein
MFRNVITALVFLALGIGAAPAGEIRVLAAVAVQDPLDRLAEAFTRATGHKVNIGYSLTAPILADIKAGKPVDAIVLPDLGRVALVAAGLLDKPVPVSASLAGVGIRADAPMPDVSTLEAFKALLRAAPSISYTDPKSGGAFGQYFARALVEIGTGRAGLLRSRRAAVACAGARLSAPFRHATERGVPAVPFTSFGVPSALSAAWEPSRAPVRRRFRPTMSAPPRRQSPRRAR